MIDVYPVKIEAIEKETRDLMFKMETVDSHAATIEFHTVIGKGNIDEVVAAMRRAVVMLELE